MDAENGIRDDEISMMKFGSLTGLQLRRPPKSGSEKKDGVHGTMPVHFDVQRTIKQAEIWALLNGLVQSGGTGCHWGGEVHLRQT